MITKLDDFMWQVELYLMKRYGVDEAKRTMYPLIWYIHTGRASTQFLKALISSKPYMIGRMLHQEGSIDETVNRIKAYLGF